MLGIMTKWPRLSDFILSILAYPAGILLKNIRKAGVQNLPRCKRTLQDVGVFPIINHYYEPLFDTRHLIHKLSDQRHLPGIDWNVREQLKILDSFSFTDELRDVPRKETEESAFFFGNICFDYGDAEYWYNLIRLKKPSRIIEIGSGYSTLMAQKALEKNKEELPDYLCKHICIEPYENLWLEEVGLNVVRQRVEEVDLDTFSELGQDDILFIDSSHIIRPKGDVLFEYLEILPSLREGVIVHLHDIFSPKDYPSDWIINDIKLWNEQYLLEAFLSHNASWKIIGALNYLQHSHHELLKAKCKSLIPMSEPGSFYIQKVR